MTSTRNIVWSNEKRKVSDLIPSDYNPRNLSIDQKNNLSESLKRFSLVDPIIVNHNNKIIGGHQRLSILKEKGVEEVDVRAPNRLLDEKEEKELNLRLNKNLGEWNLDALAHFDEDVLKDVGFESAELDKIFKSELMPEEDDVPEAPEQPKSKRGDIYQLGRHRVMCGDCVNVDDVGKLMGGGHG